MMKFLRKHDKKFMAVGMVILMISFLASGNGRSNRANSQSVIGTFDGKPVYSSERMASIQEWQTLSRYVDVYVPQLGKSVPFAKAIFRPNVYAEINDKPELFMMLRHEARLSGVRARPDEVNSIFTNNYHRPENDDADAIDEVVREGITDLLLIRGDFDRLASNVKASQPLIEQKLAEILQKLQLNVIELSAKDFVKKAPAPTTQQIKEQFDKYANVDPDRADPRTNPFDFGYRFPDRVKLQYVEIPHDQVEKAVIATKSAYDWDVQARIYYLQHKDEFTVEPTSQPTAQATATTQPSTTPAVKPYEQVREDVLHKVRDPIVNHRLLEIQGKLLTALNSDRQALMQNAPPSTGPTTSPASVAVSFASLQKLVGDIQAQYGVTILATELNRDYLSAKDLAALPRIGVSTTGQTSFPETVMQQIAAYFARTDKGTSTAVAQLIQPSPPLNDLEGDVFIFRLTDAQPAEPAPDIASVAPKIDNDLRKRAGFQMAHDLATGMLAAARTASLQSVAMTAGQTVKSTDPFSLDSRDLGPNIVLSPQGQAIFLEQAFFGGLSQYNPKTNPHPLQLIEIPPDFKLYVAQLGTVTPTWDPGTLPQSISLARVTLEKSSEQLLWQQWLDYDSVVARTGFQAKTPKS